MNPIKFKEQNRIYKAPASMPDCRDLPVYQNDEQIISCWENTPSEKLTFLLTGKIWLGVHGQGQPPVWISPVHPFVLEDENPQAEEQALKTRLDTLFKKKAQDFLDHCFTEGVEWHLDSDYSMKDILEMFLYFAFGIKQPPFNEPVEIPQEKD